MIAAVHQRDADRRVGQTPGGVEPGEPAAEDDDMRKLASVTGPSSPGASGRSARRLPPAARRPRRRTRCTSASGGSPVRQGQERRPPIPAAPAERPGRPQQVYRQPRADRGAGSETEGEGGPGGCHIYGIIGAGGQPGHRLYILPHVSRYGARATPRLSGGVSDLPALRLPQQLLPRRAVHAVPGPGERVPRPLGAAGVVGVVRRLVGGTGLPARSLRPDHRRAGGHHRAAPKHLRRAHGGRRSRSTTACAGGWWSPASISPPWPTSGSPSLTRSRSWWWRVRTG